MLTVTVDEMKNNFDKYFAEMMNGSEVKIVDGDKEVGKLTPSMYVIRDCLQKSLVSGDYGKSIKNRRKIGVGKDKIKLSDDFDEVFDALDKDVEEMFGAV